MILGDALIAGGFRHDGLRADHGHDFLHDHEKNLLRDDQGRAGVVDPSFVVVRL